MLMKELLGVENKMIPVLYVAVLLFELQKSYTTGFCKDNKLTLCEICPSSNLIFKCLDLVDLVLFIVFFSSSLTW